MKGLIKMGTKVNHPEHYQGKHECIEVMRKCSVMKLSEVFASATPTNTDLEQGRKTENQPRQILLRLGGMRTIFLKWIRSVQMIKFENTVVSGWEAAIRGMRNPMNSWDKSDSHYLISNDNRHGEIVIGDNDLALMKQLIKAGTDHSKFMRMINVTVDITAPMYWWTEADTYKVGTVRNSCSKMHKIHAKEFTRDDFSFEKAPSGADAYINHTIAELNSYRDMFNDTKSKAYWYAMIQLLPSSYNQRATVQLNYAVLRNMFHSRKNHKLDEWSIGFTYWVKSLPYSELITGEGD